MVQMEVQVGDGEDMDFEGWTPLGRGRGRGCRKSKMDEGGMFENQGSKRELEGSSSDEERIVRRKILREEFKIILKLRNEEDNNNLSPIVPSREIKKKIGDAEMVKVLRDGNLLVTSKNEEQKMKALHVESISKKMVVERKILGENKSVRGEFFGIPLDEDLD